MGELSKKKNWVIGILIGVMLFFLLPWNIDANHPPGHEKQGINSYESPVWHFTSYDPNLYSPQFVLDVGWNIYHSNAGPKLMIFGGERLFAVCINYPPENTGCIRTTIYGTPWDKR